MRKPRPRAGGQWTEAKFFGFLRSNFRLMSRKWPPRYEALQAARRPYVGDNKRQKWEFQCAACRQWFMAKNVQVDHIVPCGSLNQWSDVEGWLRRFLCEAEGFQVLCRECHLAKPKVSQ